MKSINQAIVKTTINSKTPIDFPWNSGVKVSMLGDMSNIENIIRELNEIKAMINRDANKHRVSYKDLEISIDFI